MKFAKFVIVSLIILSCSDDDGTTNIRQPEWTKLGLDGKVVNELHLSGSTLFAATTTGLFKKDLNSSGDFVQVAFAGKNVDAFEIVEGSTMIASLFDKSGSEPPALFRSTNGGQDWDELESNYGGTHPEPAIDLEVHPVHKNIIYATGLWVVAKSEDGGVNWEPIFGQWGGIGTGVSVVEVNPNNTSELWAGGQGAIENGFLLRTENEEDWDTWNDLVDNPTVVKEISFADDNPDNILVGFEGALIKTVDGGQNWKTVIESEQNRFYFGIGRGRNEKRVYAGGWLKTPDPQPLILFVSDDGGETWKEEKYVSEQYGGIFEMLVTSQENEDVLYIGLDKGGVYRVRLRGGWHDFFNPFG